MTTIKKIINAIVIFTIIGGFIGAMQIVLFSKRYSASMSLIANRNQELIEEYSGMLSNEYFIRQVRQNGLKTISKNSVTLSHNGTSDLFELSAVANTPREARKILRVYASTLMKNVALYYGDGNVASVSSIKVEKRISKQSILEKVLVGAVIGSLLGTGLVLVLWLFVGNSSEAWERIVFRRIIIGVIRG